MKRIFDSIEDYFGFSRKEARGFIAILALMILCWIVPFLYRRFSTKTETQTTDKQQLDSLTAVLSNIKVEEKKQYYNDNYQEHFTPKNYSPDHNFTANLSNFDPNTASVGQLQSLGIPQFLAERIAKYRSKGGKFRKKEDLAKIYGLQPKLYDRLAPYIQITENSQPQLSTQNSLLTTQNPQFTTQSPPPTTQSPTTRYAKPTPFDINTADTTQLVKLRGIGSKLAVRVVKFRDALGGFHSQKQYSEIFGLDSLAVSELQRLALVKSPVHKIAINTATTEEIDRLPYLSFKQAQIIVRYREQHGAYKSAQDLAKIKIFDAVLIEKISPYLSFE